MMKRLLPTTLFGRMMLIILLPMALVQIVTILVFYERHWDTVTRYMSNNLAADIAVVADRFSADPSAANLVAARDFAHRYFHFGLDWNEGGAVSPAVPAPSAPDAERMLHIALSDRIEQPFGLDLYSDPDLIAILIQYPDGVLRVVSSRKRIFSSTSWLVILWTVSTSVLFFAIALVFVRGQVRPIRHLAKAARQLGMGRTTTDFKVEGAREVRLAGRAFQAMRQRILRQIVERTEMLAGVSHDLRTPLTRMKLQLSYLPEGDARSSLEADIREMESMINGYIDFAGTAVVEGMVETDLAELVRGSIASQNPEKGQIELQLPEEGLPLMQLRRTGVRRGMENIIANAIRYGQKCRVAIELDDEQVQIIVDDDGPGIPKDQRISVLRPFVQLDKGHRESGGGAGLGLSIANDAALAHGGQLLLGESPMGGLRARMQIPRY